MKFDHYMFDRRSDVSTMLKKQEEYMGIEEKFWVTHEGVDYLYKLDSGSNLGFGELLFSYICQKVGLNVVKCYPAQDQKKKTRGVIVESFLTEVVKRKISLEDLQEKYNTLSDEDKLAGRCTVLDILKMEKKSSCMTAWKIY